MIVAMFEREDGLSRALSRFRAAQIGPLETYTPAPLSEAAAGSPIPLIILATGSLAVAASFGLQWYSSVFAYRLDIGGRPDFAWVSFIPTVFENAVLIAMAAGFVAFLAMNGMPRLYERVDEADSMRRASRDRWVLQVASEDAAVLDAARTLLRDLHPLLVEELEG